MGWLVQTRYSMRKSSLVKEYVQFDAGDKSKRTKVKDVCEFRPRERKKMKEVVLLENCGRE